MLLHAWSATHVQHCRTVHDVRSSKTPATGPIKSTYTDYRALHRRQSILRRRDLIFAVGGDHGAVHDCRSSSPALHEKSRATVVTGTAGMFHLMQISAEQNREPSESRMTFPASDAPQKHPDPRPVIIPIEITPWLLLWLRLLPSLTV